MLHLSVRLRVQWRGVSLLKVLKSADFSKHQLVPWLLWSWWGTLTNELAPYFLTNSSGLLVWYWVTLSQFSQIVTKHQYKFALSRGFWQWAKNVSIQMSMSWSIIPRSQTYSRIQSNMQAVPRDPWPGQQRAKGIISSKAETCTWQVIPVLLDKLNNCQELTTGHIIVPFTLGQCPTCKHNELFQPITKLITLPQFNGLMRRWLTQTFPPWSGRPGLDISKPFRLSKVNWDCTF